MIPTPAVCGRGGWTREAWIGQQNGRKATLYVIRLTGNGETFYKIGITFSFSARFSRLRVPYAIRTMARYSSWNAGRIWDLEAKLLARFSPIKYQPELSFSGSTECFAAVAEILAALPKNTFFLKHTLNSYEV